MRLRVMRHPLPHADARLTGLVCAAALLLSACGTVRPPVASAPEEGGRPTAQAAPATRPASNAPVLPAAGSGRGGYYLDDGPGDAPPPNLAAVPDAEPKIEPYSVRGNKPYVVFGKTYVPVTDNQPLKQRGMGSWYGKKFHGQKTSSGELYDMYKMTAAHPTLPIPSYARVTNLKNGNQVIVRVNDRGPFHSSRIIDLSYTAALKLGYIGHGSAELEVERLLPDEIARINAQGRNQTAAASERARPPAGNASPAVAANTQFAPSGVGPIPLSPAAPAPVMLSPASLPAPLALTAVTTAAPAATAATAATIATIATIAGDSVSMDDFLKMQAADPSASPSAMTNVAAMASSAVPSTETAAMPISATSPPPADSDATLATGFYLQFGAYSRSANAEQLRLQLLQHWPAGVPSPEVRRNGALYRLFSGPFASREAAASAAGQLSANPPARPLIVTR